MSRKVWQAIKDRHCDACAEPIATGCEVYDSDGNTYCPACQDEKEAETEAEGSGDSEIDDDMFF